MLWEECKKRIRVLQDGNISSRHTAHLKPLHMLHMMSRDSITSSFRSRSSRGGSLEKFLARGGKAAGGTRWHWKPCGLGIFTDILCAKRHLVGSSTFLLKSLVPWPCHLQSHFTRFSISIDNYIIKIRCHWVFLNCRVFILFSHTFGKEFNMRCTYQFRFLAKNI